MDRELFEGEHLAMIAVAEAGWKGSPCWHVFDWMCWKLRCKYPLVRNEDQIINMDYRGG